MTRSVLVRGVGSHNGGAELLLRATTEHFAGTSIRVYADARRVSRQLRASWGVGGYLSVPKFGRFESLGLAAAPKAVTDVIRYKSTRHLDGVLDASGFFVGDQWSASSIARDTETFRQLAARGKPTVMLPQAFGPFSKPDVASAARELFSHVDLIFARDEQSRAHVVELIDSDAKVRLCPDITIALNVKKTTHAEQSGRVAIVPNINITARSQDPATKGNYVRSLRSMYDSLASLGYEPFFLVHSSHGDPTVVEAVAEQGGSISVETPSDGLAAKALIGQCDGVIAGRYHAIVSALSQGVPSVAHSWSHKYGALLSDFGVREGLADPLQPQASVELIVRLMSDPEYHRTIVQSKPALVATVSSMWSEVDSLLSTKG